MSPYLGIGALGFGSDPTVTQKCGMSLTGKDIHVHEHVHFKELKCYVRSYFGGLKMRGQCGGHFWKKGEGFCLDKEGSIG
jgi:hypothetical protein